MENGNLAFISAYDKTNVPELAVGLHHENFEIYGTSGSQTAIRKEAGIEIGTTSELLDRLGLAVSGIKMSRHVEAALLGMHLSEPRYSFTEPFVDVVYVNPIPKGKTGRELFDSERGQFCDDIGGVTLLQSAAHSTRLVMHDAGQIDEFLKWQEMGRPYETDMRLALASMVFSQLGRRSWDFGGAVIDTFSKLPPFGKTP